MESVKVTTLTNDSIQLLSWLKMGFKGQDVYISPKSSQTWHDGFSLEAATIIVSGASIISALIVSLIAYLSNKGTGVIKIVGTSGRSIEFPKDTPPDKINDIIELAKNIDVDKIILS